MKIINRCLVAVIMMFVCVSIRSTKVSASETKVVTGLNKESITMYVGETEQLIITGNFGEIKWESLDNRIAEVDNKGRVSANGVGETYILANVDSKSFICYIVVKKADINKKSGTTYIGGLTEQLQIYGLNEQKVVWKTDNDKIAKVTSNGEVIGITIGTVTITATMGGEKFTCVIHVKSPYVSEKRIQVKVNGVEQIALMGSSGKVIYQSSDESIATVDDKGIIHGKKEGNVSIVLVYKNIKYYAKVVVVRTRLSVDSDEIWMNQKTVLTVNFKNRVKGEDITVIDPKGILEIQTQTWGNDTIKVNLLPKKDGITTIIISRQNSTETIEIPVHVTVRRILSAEEIYKQYVKASVSILIYDAAGNEKMGSGFFIGSGKIVTNYHVIEYANDMEISDINGKKYKVNAIYDYDTSLNLAVLEVERTNDTIFFMNTNAVETGESIYALGSPYQYAGTLSEGMISYANRILDNIHYIQMSASISKSSGGGPLINSYGEVIGVNTLTVTLAQNINLSIKIGYINRLNMENKRSIEEFYEENKDKVMTDMIEIIIG